MKKTTKVERDFNYKNFISEGREEVSSSLENKWVNSENELLKHASTSALGNFGEDLLVKIFNHHGHKARRVNGGIGEYDVLFDERIRLEVKTATEDISGGFQWNGIRMSVDYDFALCLGVSPNDFHINMWSKEYCVDNLTTSMFKGGVDSYKLSGGPRSRKWRAYPLNEENFEKYIINEIYEEII